MISTLQTCNTSAWPRVPTCDDISFFTFNTRSTLNYKSPMLSKPTSQLRSRTGAREDGSNATATPILWFPTGVWVSDWVSVCFFLIFGFSVPLFLPCKYTCMCRLQFFAYQLSIFSLNKYFFSPIVFWISSTWSLTVKDNENLFLLKASKG